MLAEDVASWVRMQLTAKDKFAWNVIHRWFQVQDITEFGVLRITNGLD